jgi:hypothetical protein
MNKIWVVALAALVSATGASAAAPDSATQEKQVCKTEKVTGSRTRTQRICMTQTQWRELEARTRKGLEEMGQAASGGHHRGMETGPGGPGAM